MITSSSVAILVQFELLVNRSFLFRKGAMFTPFSGLWFTSPQTEDAPQNEIENAPQNEIEDEPMDEDDQASSDEEAITTMMMMAELEFDRDWEGCMCDNEFAAIREATERAEAKGLTLHALLVSEPKPKPQHTARGGQE